MGGSGRTVDLERNGKRLRVVIEADRSKCCGYLYPEPENIPHSLGFSFKPGSLKRIPRKLLRRKLIFRATATVSAPPEFPKATWWEPGTTTSEFAVRPAKAR